MDNWIIKNNILTDEEIVNNGNRMLIGNGFMGYRGTLEEYGSRELVALNIPALYDKSGKWCETVNAPNPLCVKVCENDEPPLSHSAELDFRYGIFSRKSEFSNYQIESYRFISMADKNIIYLNYNITAKKDTDLKIKLGIDINDIWDINGKHLENFKISIDGKRVLVRCNTKELKIPIEMSQTIITSFSEESYKINNSMLELSFKAKKDETYSFEIITALCHGNEKDFKLGKSDEELTRAFEIHKNDKTELLKRHKCRFDELWEECDVEISGDDRAQYGIRYSIYHLLIIAPYYSAEQSVAARGLSGQVYKGAVFWDTEMFMMPFYSYTLNEVAKNIISYRLSGLKGAREKAKELGFNGAFYAWESGKDGKESCTNFNVTDVFTGRPIRTYFRDKQIHINGAVVLGIWNYFKITGDKILLNDSFDVIKECSEFYIDFLYYKPQKDRYEIIDVVGPDEYHERVYNNFYTNMVVKKTFDILLETALLSGKSDEFLDRVNEISKKLYIPEPNDEKIIEQFEGYFDLEDISIDELKKRIINPKEYLGTNSGIAFTTKIIKQADVILALNELGDDYDNEIKEKNFNYYEPRTEHGSSLSPCIYGLLASKIGKNDYAYNYFLKSAEIDINGGHKNWAGDIYIGGTHPAANAGAWRMVTEGFCGLCIENGKPKVKSRLPESIKAIRFKCTVAEVKYKIEVTKTSEIIEKIF